VWKGMSVRVLWVFAFVVYFQFLPFYYLFVLFLFLFACMFSGYNMQKYATLHDVLCQRGSISDLREETSFGRKDDHAGKETRLIGSRA
jgi:hypothetical protein